MIKSKSVLTNAETSIEQAKKALKSEGYSDIEIHYPDHQKIKSPVLVIGNKIV